MHNKLTIEDLQKEAELHEGELLDTEYSGVRTSYSWRCREGHVFKMLGQAVRAGRWCRVCAGERVREFFNYRVPSRQAKVVANVDVEVFVRDRSFVMEKGCKVPYKY